MQTASRTYHNNTFTGYLTAEKSVKNVRISYIYGYQGSEKDDEIKGEGNSYTTEFRQYDPRLGRWFSTDPVIKPFISPYNSMSNNPIIRIDPKGDDDYFNADGSFSHSTKTKTNNIYVKDENGKNVLLSNLDLNNLKSEAVALLVINHYANTLNISGFVLFQRNDSKTSSENPAFTQDGSIFINNAKSKTYLIDGKLVNLDKAMSSMLSDFNNLKSILYHEQLHQKDHKSKNYSGDDDFKGLLNHTNIYIKQMEHSSFQNTTQDYKDGTVGALKKYFEDSFRAAVNDLDSEKSQDQVLDLVNKFNKGAGKKYGYYISAKQTAIDGNYVWTVEINETKTK